MSEINTAVCVYLRHQTFQLIDSVSVRWVCGQPLGGARRPTQLVPDLHFFPEDGGCSDVCASLERRAHTNRRPSVSVKITSYVYSLV